MSEEVFKLSENFAKNVFNDAVMAEKLPSKTYKALKETIETGRSQITENDLRSLTPGICVNFFFYINYKQLQRL